MAPTAEAELLHALWPAVWSPGQAGLQRGAGLAWDQCAGLIQAALWVTSLAICSPGGGGPGTGIPEHQGAVCEGGVEQGQTWFPAGTSLWGPQSSASSSQSLSREMLLLVPWGPTAPLFCSKGAGARMEN